MPNIRPSFPIRAILIAAAALVAGASDSNFEKNALIGPSIHVRPRPEMHVDLAAMAGLTEQSPRSKVVMILGWEF